MGLSGFLSVFSVFVDKIIRDKRKLFCVMLVMNTHFLSNYCLRMWMSKPNHDG